MRFFKIIALLLFAFISIGSLKAQYTEPSKDDLVQLLKVTPEENLILYSSDGVPISFRLLPGSIKSANLAKIGSNVPPSKYKEISKIIPKNGKLGVIIILGTVATATYNEWKNN